MPPLSAKEPLTLLRRLPELLLASRTPRDPRARTPRPGARPTNLAWLPRVDRCVYQRYGLLLYSPTHQAGCVCVAGCACCL